MYLHKHDIKVNMNMKYVVRILKLNWVFFADILFYNLYVYVSPNVEKNISTKMK